MATVTSELAKTEDAIERYLLAFEAGTLPEAQCGQRIRTLGAKAAELHARRAELEDLIRASDAPELSQDTLTSLRDRMAETIKNGNATAKKGMLQNLVAEVCVEGRHAIRPRFRVPLGSPMANPDSSGEEEKIRTPSGSVPPRGFSKQG